MQLEEIVLGLIALLIGVPSIRRNPTAAALVFAWLVSTQVVYRLTGRAVAPEYLLFPDIFTIMLIFAKPDYAPCPRFRSYWHQAACILLERSPADRLILLSFPLVWWFYVAPIAPYYQYWGLWWAAVVQFLAAGWEGFPNILHRRNADAADKPPGKGLMLVAYSAGGCSG